MKISPDVFRLFVTVAMLGLGSYGAYILFGEFVGLEKFLSIRQFLVIVRKRWYAVLALAMAFALFFYRLFIGLSG
jgi:hypothetical protein